MGDRDFFRGAFIGMAGTLAGVILLQMTGTHVFSVGDGVLSKEKYVEKLEYIEELVDESFLGDIIEDDLAEGMYAGFLSGLKDPYSYYYTEEEYEEENRYTEGSYVGIGVTLLKNENGGTKIVDVYDGFPGSKAGLESGDLIVGVDELDATEMESSEIANYIRNCGKDSVVMKIYKEEAAEPMEVTVKLEVVELPSVESEMLPDQTGYIKITQFTGVAHTQFQSAFESLTESGMEKLVVDLRDNPGGLLNSVCDILEEILPEGLIVYMEDKHGEREEIYSKGKTPLTIPLAVLVNGNSASASEIFAGAVKDYEIGTIVGTTTFGKGVVQAIQPLQDGSAVKLTIANYFTPKGNNIHGIGIEPDVEVKLDESLLNRTDYTHEEDNQLQKALEILNK